MRRKSYWSRSVGLLGGTATFDVYTPDDIEMVATDILMPKLVFLERSHEPTGEHDQSQEHSGGKCQGQTAAYRA